jgi:hypothetical protein
VLDVGRATGDHAENYALCVLTAVVSILSALIGAVAAWVLATVSDRWRARSGLTVERFRTFNDPAVLAQRNRVWRQLGARRADRQSLDIRDLERELDNTDWLPLSALLHTFDFVATLTRKGWLREKTVDDLFGRYGEVWRPFLQDLLCPAADEGKGPWSALALNVLTFLQAQRVRMKLPTSAVVEGGAPNPGVADRSCIDTRGPNL